MWFQNLRATPPELNQGDRFRRPTRFDGVETAEIICVSPDMLGIPHVRFNVKISNTMMVTEETRTLSLESFRNLYPGENRLRR